MRTVTLVSIGVALVITSQTVTAATVTVLSAGAVRAGLTEIVERFQKETGHDVKVTSTGEPQLHARLKARDPLDVVVAPMEMLEEPAVAALFASRPITVGSIGIGAAMRAGSPPPDFSTTEKFRRAMLDADAVVFSSVASGMVVEGILKKIGLYDQLQGKIVRYEDGNAVMAHVAKSSGRDFGFGMVTGIAQQRANGLALAGALPPEIQQATTYGAAISSAGNKEVAGQFLRYLDAASSRQVLRDAGIQ